MFKKRRLIGGADTMHGESEKCTQNIGWEIRKRNLETNSSARG
jgi:hypothetical protein